MRSVAACLGILLVAAAPPARNPSPLRAGPDVSGGPYCGIYCVYAALRSLGLEVRLGSLASPDYVGSFQGSTASELARAIFLHLFIGYTVAQILVLCQGLSTPGVEAS